MIGTIDVRDLVGRPGASKVEQVAGTIEDLRTELAGVSDDAPIRGEVVLESLTEGIHTRIPTSTPWTPKASWSPIRWSVM